MESFLILAIVLGVICAYQYYREVQNKKEVEENRYYEQLMTENKSDINKNESQENEKIRHMGTKDLFLATLTKIGCQYELAEEEDDNSIYFAYQGENFVVDASNENNYIRIWDTHWGHVELYNVDELSRLKKAINNSNLNTGVTTVYTIDEVGHNVDVHCKSVVLFIEQIPDIENYLRVELNEFFRAHQYVGNEMVKQREAENA
jgi:hypothetical protein